MGQAPLMIFRGVSPPQSSPLVPPLLQSVISRLAINWGINSRNIKCNMSHSYTHYNCHPNKLKTCNTYKHYKHYYSPHLPNCSTIPRPEISTITFLLPRTPLILIRFHVQSPSPHKQEININYINITIQTNGGYINHGRLLGQIK